MAEKRKIRVLYPTAALAMGLKTDDGDVVVAEAHVADALVAQGAAEEVKTETAAKEPSAAKTKK